MPILETVNITNAEIEKINSGETNAPTLESLKNQVKRMILSKLSDAKLRTEVEKVNKLLNWENGLDNLGNNVIYGQTNDEKLKAQRLRKWANTALAIIVVEQEIINKGSAATINLPAEKVFKQIINIFSSSSKNFLVDEDIVELSEWKKVGEEYEKIIYRQVWNCAIARINKELDKNKSLEFTRKDIESELKNKAMKSEFINWTNTSNDWETSISEHHDVNDLENLEKEIIAEINNIVWTKAFERTNIAGNTDEINKWKDAASTTKFSANESATVHGKGFSCDQIVAQQYLFSDDNQIFCSPLFNKKDEADNFFVLWNNFKNPADWDSLVNAIKQLEQDNVYNNQAEQATREAIQKDFQGVLVKLIKQASDKNALEKLKNNYSTHGFYQKIAADEKRLIDDAYNTKLSSLDNAPNNLSWQQERSRLIRGENIPALSQDGNSKKFFTEQKNAIEALSETAFAELKNLVIVLIDSDDSNGVKTLKDLTDFESAATQIGDKKTVWDLAKNTKDKENNNWIDSAKTKLSARDHSSKDNALQSLKTTVDNENIYNVISASLNSDTISASTVKKAEEIWKKSVVAYDKKSWDRTLYDELTNLKNSDKTAWDAVNNHKNEKNEAYADGAIKHLDGKKNGEKNDLGNLLFAGDSPAFQQERARFKTTDTYKNDSNKWDRIIVRAEVAAKLRSLSDKTREDEKLADLLVILVHHYGSDNKSKLEEKKQELKTFKDAVDGDKKKARERQGVQANLEELYQEVSTKLTKLENNQDDNKETMPNNDSFWSWGKKTAITLGILAGIALLLGVIYYYLRRRDTSGEVF